jgi:hypothetical protein
MAFLPERNSSFLVRDLVADWRITLKLIVNTVRGCKFIWFKTGIFCVFENGNKTLCSKKGY